jgi:hypothetical protein
MTGVRFPAGAGYFSARHRFQTDYGAHSAFCSMDIGGGGFLSATVERPEHETEHIPPVSVKVNAWSYTSTSQYVFMEWWLGKNRDYFALPFDWV